MPGLASLRARRLTVPDLEALTAFAMFETNSLYLDHQRIHLEADDQPPLPEATGGIKTNCREKRSRWRRRFAR